MSFPVAGLIHEYAPRLIAFEFTPTSHKNVIIFVGGLMDGLLTVPYLQNLAIELSKINFTLIQIQISSSHIGWGTGSLNRDSNEISKLIKYLKSNKGGNRTKIGLMGHSTGCQNTIHYFTRQNRDNKEFYSTIDFGILQAPVSDRISASTIMNNDEILNSIKLSKELINNNQGNHIMPYEFTKHFFNVPISAYRWNSLISIGGDDDFFSPDLSMNDYLSTFGKFDKPFLVLYSGSDEYVPDWLDKDELMTKWEKASGLNWSPFSTIVKGAKHNIGEGSDSDSEKIAIDAVINFINSI